MHPAWGTFPNHPIEASLEEARQIMMNIQQDNADQDARLDRLEARLAELEAQRKP
jgi:hypothetical protein